MSPLLDTRLSDPRLSPVDDIKLAPDKDPRLSPIEDPRLSDTLEQNSIIPEVARQVAIGFGNEALLGFPLFGLEKMKGIEAREALTSEVKAGRIARGIGSAGGFMVGLPEGILGWWKTCRKGIDKSSPQSRKVSSSCC